MAIKTIGIPEERRAVIIGRGGSVRRDIERRTKTRITVTDYVQIEGEDPLLLIKAEEVVRAIARGFSPERALLLFKEDFVLNIIPLHEKKNTVKRLMARVIGKKGSTRKKIEDTTSTCLSIYGKTVSIIGMRDDAERAGEIVEMLLAGRSHSFAYAKLASGATRLPGRKPRKSSNKSN